jgi:hypothetical protein
MDYTKGAWIERMGDIWAGKERIAIIEYLGYQRSEEAASNACLIAAAPDMYIANIAYDCAIGSAIIELSKGTPLPDVLNRYLLPAQLTGRLAIAKVEGKPNV